MGTWSFPGVKSGWSVTLTPDPLLVPWSWMSRAIPLHPLWVVRPVQSFSACTRVHFTFFTGRMMMIQQNLHNYRKICPSATLSNISPTCAGLGSNPGLCSDRPVTNCLSMSQGMAPKCCCSFPYSVVYTELLWPWSWSVKKYCKRHTHSNSLVLKEFCDKWSSEFAERGGISVSHPEFIFLFTKFSQDQNLYYGYDT